MENQQDDPSRQEQPRPPTVLLIEDDDSTREAYAELIREVLHYDVAEAADGREGLERLRAGLQPALILLDLWMPTMDGFAFRRAHRADPTLAQCPVLICSASGSDPAAGLELDAAVCLQKPTDPHVLLAVIELLCGTARRSEAA